MVNFPVFTDEFGGRVLSYPRVSLRSTPGYSIASLSRASHVSLTFLLLSPNIINS